MSSGWLPPELPQLTRLVNSVGPVDLEHLLANSPLASLRAKDFRLERIRYRPQRNCLITWSVSLENGTSRQQSFVSLLVCRDGESGDHLATIGPYPADISRNAIHLPELDAVLRIFPQDRKLRGIIALADPPALVADLALTLKAVDPFGTLELIQFVAERSCTVRVQLRGGAGWAYGKFYRPGESRTAWELMNRLWNSEPSQAGRLVIPAPLTLDPVTESVWVQGLAGQSLELGASDERLFETGRTVAVLHTLPGDGLAEVTDVLLMEQLRRAIETILLVRPELNGRLVRLAKILTPSGVDQPVTLHGDLHLKNIFGLGDSQIGLIDLDNVVRGDRWLDLASLAAYLCYVSLVAQTDNNRVSHQIEQLRAGYKAASGLIIDERRWGRMVARALLTERAYRCITRLKPNLSTDLERLVVMAERMVES
jgi:hypothetical protein